MVGGGKKQNTSYSLEYTPKCIKKYLKMMTMNDGINFLVLVLGISQIVCIAFIK